MDMLQFGLSQALIRTLSDAMSCAQTLEGISSAPHNAQHLFSTPQRTAPLPTPVSALLPGGAARIWGLFRAACMDMLHVLASHKQPHQDFEWCITGWMI